MGETMSDTRAHRFSSHRALYWLKSHSLIHTIIILPYLGMRFLFGNKFPMPKEEYLQKLGISPEAIFWKDFHGGYEKEVSKKLLTIHGNLYVDVGTYYGHYLLLLHKNFKAMVGFEPFPNNREICLRILKTKEVENVVVYQQAVSDSMGQDVLYEGDSDSNTIEPHEQFQSRGKLLIWINTIDNMFHDDVIDLLKVDAERAEWKVLKGAAQMLQMRRIKHILIEIHDDADRNPMEVNLNSLGFITTWLDSNHVWGELR